MVIFCRDNYQLTLQTCLHFFFPIPGGGSNKGMGEAWLAGVKPHTWDLLMGFMYMGFIQIYRDLKRFIWIYRDL